MPPRATVVIDAAPPVRVTVDIDVGATAGATTADYLGALVQRRLAGRSAGLASGVQQCAADAEQLAASLVYVEDAIRAAVDRSAACAGLLQSVSSQSSEPTPPATLVDEMLSHAGPYAKNLRRDLTVRALSIIARF